MDKKFIKKTLKSSSLIIFFMFFLVLIVSVSYNKIYDSLNNKITISDNSNKKIAEYTLDYNTLYCGSECYALFSINISNEKIFDSFKFKDKENKNKNINISFYLFENGNYTEYDGKKRDGFFKGKLIGKKDFRENIDWILNNFGLDFDEWAWWNSWQDWNDDFEDNIFNTTLFDNRTISCRTGGAGDPNAYPSGIFEGGGNVTMKGYTICSGGGYYCSKTGNIWAKQDFNDNREYTIQVNMNTSTPMPYGVTDVYRFFINNGSYHDKSIATCEDISAEGIMLKELTHSQMSEYGGIFNITLNKTTATLKTFNGTILNNSADISTLVLRYVLFEGRGVECGNCEAGYVLNIYNFTVFSQDSLNINLITPLNNTNYPETIDFNCNVSTNGYSLKNITMFIWNSTGIYNNTLSKQISGLSNSTNNTLTFSTDGTYYFNCLVFNSNNFSSFNSQNNTFFVSTGSPSINLNYPTNNKFFNNGINIYFNYTALDKDGLSACELWSNWTGNWIRNYTWVNPTNNTMNYTIVNLSNDGHFIWNIKCNDTSNNQGFSNNNYTFTIDTIKPTPIINSITTTAGSQTITFNSTETDINLNNCFYTILNSSNGIDGTNNNVSYTCGLSLSHSATVSSYSTFNLTIYANDLAGNENSTTSSFTTSESLGGSSSGGGGGGGTVEKVQVIALVKPINSTSQLTNLQRAIVYKEINEIKKLVFGTFAILLSDQDLADLKERLQNKGITMDLEELTLWVEQYENGKVDKVYLDKKYVDEFGLVLATGTYCGDGFCQSEGNDLGMKEGYYNCNQDCPASNVDTATLNCFDNNPETQCIWDDVTYQYLALFLGVIILSSYIFNSKSKTGKQTPLHRYYRYKIKTIKSKRFK